MKFSNTLAVATAIVFAAGSVNAEPPARYCVLGVAIDAGGGCRNNEMCCDITVDGNVAKDLFPKAHEGANGACCNAEGQTCPVLSKGHTECQRKPRNRPERYCVVGEALTAAGGCNDSEACCDIRLNGAVPRELFPDAPDNTNGACCASRGRCPNPALGETGCR